MQRALKPGLQRGTNIGHSGLSIAACRHQLCALELLSLRKTKGVSAAAVTPKQSQQVPESQIHSAAAGADRFDAQGLLEELKDQTDLGKRGEGWTIAQLVAIPLILFPPFHLEKVITVLGVLMVLGGLSAMFLGQRDLGKSLTPLPQPRKDSEFVNSGIYEYVRHPMYGGLVLASLGVAAATHDETRLLLALGLWLVLEQKIALEENFLVERYGTTYDAYRATVKKLFPYLY